MKGIGWSYYIVEVYLTTCKYKNTFCDYQVCINFEVVFTLCFTVYHSIYQTSYIGLQVKARKVECLGVGL